MRRVFHRLLASPWNAPSPGLAETLTTAGKFLALGLGPAAAKHWVPSGIVTALVLVTSVGPLFVAYRR